MADCEKAAIANNGVGGDTKTKVASYSRRSLVRILLAVLASILTISECTGKKPFEIDQFAPVDDKENMAGIIRVFGRQDVGSVLPIKQISAPPPQRKEYYR